MKKILFFLAIILANSSFGQKPDTTYFSERRNKVATYAEANYFRITKKLNDTTYMVNEYFTANKSLHMKGVYYDKEQKIKNGQFLYYSEESLILKEENYNNDLKNGQFLFYSENGDTIKVENYKKGLKQGRFYKFEAKGKYSIESIYNADSIVSKHCIDSNNVSHDCDKVLTKVIFTGSSSIEEQILKDFDVSVLEKQGVLIVEFVIDEFGNVKSAIITKSFGCSACDAELIRVVKKLKFKPATMMGQKIETTMRVPLSFVFAE